MEITQEYNVDYASQRMVIAMGEIGICLKFEVGQFSFLLLRTVQVEPRSEHFCRTIINFLLTWPKTNRVENLSEVLKVD
jgi:hypothetical protein